MTKWTHFWDMSSGGGQKLNWNHIYIQAPESKAKIVFYNLFGRNPERVTCTCCGPDYSIDEDNNLARITGYHRNCIALETPVNEKGLYQNDLKDEWFQEHYYLENLDELAEAKKRGFNISEWNSKKDFSKVIALEDYIKSNDVKVVYAKDIKAEDLKGEVPEEGYVWQE